MNDKKDKTEKLQAQELDLNDPNQALAAQEQVLASAKRDLIRMSLVQGPFSPAFRQLVALRQMEELSSIRMLLANPPRIQM